MDDLQRKGSIVVEGKFNSLLPLLQPILELEFNYLTDSITGFLLSLPPSPLFLFQKPFNHDCHGSPGR